MENNDNTREQMQKLKECVENGVKGVIDGNGLIVIAVTETGLRMEAFNCDEEELHDVLAAAHEIVCPDDGEETLQ